MPGLKKELNTLQSISQKETQEKREKAEKSGFRAQQHLNATFSYFMRITKIVCIAIWVKQDRDRNCPQ